MAIDIKDGIFPLLFSTSSLLGSVLKSRSAIVVNDSWKSGDAYEYFMGRWSSLAAREFLKWLSPGHGLRWLDVGCGSGALSEAVMQEFHPRQLTAIDQSEGFVRTAQKRLNSKAVCKVGNALSLPVENAGVDVTVSGLVLNFIPDAEKAVQEMKRVTAPGGVVAIYVWDYAGTMDFLQIFWNAAAELDSKASALDEAKRFSNCNLSALQQLFTEAGFVQVTAGSLDLETRFTDFDDYWNPFLGGQGPAPTYAMSLGETDRERLKALLRKRLPIQENGSIPLSARALAVKATIPHI